MLAGLKTQWSRCCYRQQAPWKFAQGFFAEQLHQVLESLPVHLWKDIRRKRSYVNQVLARGEVDSSYKPARKLWRRAQNGHYFPNPDLLIRWGEDWLAVYELLNMLPDGHPKLPHIWPPKLLHPGSSNPRFLVGLVLPCLHGNFSLNFCKKAVWQAQRVRPKAKGRGAVGNCRIGAQHRLSTGSPCGQDSCPRRAGTPPTVRIGGL